VIEFLEEIVHVVEVGPHLGSFRPALAHDVYGFRWRGALADRRPDQGWRLHHFLDYICEIRSRDTRLNLIQHAISIGDVDRSLSSTNIRDSCVAQISRAMLYELREKHLSWAPHC